MEISTGANIKNEAVIENLKKLTNQIFKLLPDWEEALDWQTPLGTIIEELSGMDKLLIDYHEKLFSLLCKLKGLYDYKEDDERDDFSDYRRTIFECLNILSNIKNEVEQCQD